ncbi:phosphotransferase enzyme family protein [Paenibacillus puldeungensis]|uniref:Phosphotransferase enzyme family protein n=1 Tax=Paenibacillus puldeungensis TaxID=696536 RepID=A0ABW3RVW2_9BACL
MTNKELQLLLSKYGMIDPSIQFLRHNENRTYRVNDCGGASYLLRIHQPYKESMTGMQHTYEGLLIEMDMLEELSRQTILTSQKPLRSLDGQLVTMLEHEGKKLNATMLTWLEGRDLNKDDVADPERVLALGRHLSELHAFFHLYPKGQLDKRPRQDIAYNTKMVGTIQRGLELGLFQASDIDTITSTINLINSRLEGTGNNGFGLIHGDISMGNTLITDDGGIAIIDYGFFGTGYYLLDVAMGAMMVPAELRDTFLEGYYGRERGQVTEYDIVLMEGFMIVAIIGYYAFQMGNTSVHDWMRDRMPKLCRNYCRPFLNNERIFYTC